MRLQGVGVAKEAAVLIDGKHRDFADLKLGMIVSLHFCESKAAQIDRIEVRANSFEDRIVRGVDPERRTIRLGIKGTPISGDIAVDTDATIVLDGRRCGLSELKPGMPVVAVRAVSRADGPLVTFIRADSR
jgi:hypothetical protein